MIKILLFIFIFIIQFPLFGDNNKAYIENEIKNMNLLLKKAKFESGFVIMHNDTIWPDILKYRKNKEMNYFLFCITKSNNDSINFYTAEEIEGYQIGNNYYKRHYSNEEYFFIKQIKSGSINLYERISIPSEDKFLYYFEFPNYSNYYIINPFENNLTSEIMPEDSYTRTSARPSTVKLKGIPENFELFIKIYLGDCEAVINMMKTGFYTIFDIPEIVETYNNCFDSE